MKLTLAILVALIVAYFLSRRNRECRILSRILYSKSYGVACQLHREAMVRFSDEEKRAGHPDMPSPPIHEATGETITLKMFVEKVGAVGAIELRCHDRSDRLSYWTGHFALPAGSKTVFARFQGVEVQGVVAQVDRAMGSIMLMPTSVDAEAVGEMRLALR
jgi:hypothetical protein